MYPIGVLHSVHSAIFYPEVPNRIGYVQAGDGTTIFVALWEFDVKPGSEERFESVYGPCGGWAKLFQSDPAYQRTLLLRDPFRPSTYVTCDFWSNQTAYQSFRRTQSDAYLELDKVGEELTLAERKIGAFEQIT